MAPFTFPPTPAKAVAAFYGSND